MFLSQFRWFVIEQDIRRRLPSSPSNLYPQLLWPTNDRPECPSTPETQSSSSQTVSEAINLNHQFQAKLYLLKNGDAEPELEVVLDADEDVLNESWSESAPVIGCPVDPNPALPLEDGDEGMFP